MNACVNVVRLLVLVPGHLKAWVVVPSTEKRFLEISHSSQVIFRRPALFHETGNHTQLCIDFTNIVRM